MATHFTKDDFIPLDELVQQLANSCDAAASIFEDLSEHLSSIHKLLEHLIKQADNAESLLMKRCQDRRKDWLYILESLSYALCELQEHVATYYEVGPDIWLQADDAQRQFENLRSEVMVGYDAVDIFVDSLGLSPAGRKDQTLGQIEKLLVEAMREERRGIADHGVTRAATGVGGFGQVQRYLRKEGVDRAEVERHDARTKQLLIWVLENEPALSETMERELSFSEAEQTLQDMVHSASVRFPKAMHHASLLNDDDDKEKVANDEKSKHDQGTITSTEVNNEEEDLELTAILVDRTRPSTSLRPSSAATSAPSLIEAEDESDWELV